MQKSIGVSVESGGLLLVRMVRLAAAATFIVEGGLKLAGTADIIRVFEVIGFGQWLRYLAGGVEMCGGVALLLPRASLAGMTVLMSMIFGAFFTHLFVLGSSPAEPALLLAALLVYSRVRPEPETESPAVRPRRHRPLRISRRGGNQEHRNLREHRLTCDFHHRQI